MPHQPPGQCEPDGRGFLQVPEERPDFLAHNDSDFVRTPGDYTVEMRDEEVRIFDRDGTQLTRIWGDPHVEEADGETNWHFGEDSTFILPDGTKISLDTEPNEAGEWYVVGVDITVGSDRYHYGVGDEAGLTGDGKEWDREHADRSDDASAGVFALQANGEWAVQAADGNFYDISTESWEDYLDDRDIDFDKCKVVEGITPQQIEAGRSRPSGGHCGPPVDMPPRHREMVLTCAPQLMKELAKCPERAQELGRIPIREFRELLRTSPAMLMDGSRGGRRRRSERPWEQQGVGRWWDKRMLSAG